MEQQGGTGACSFGKIYTPADTLVYPRYSRSLAPITRNTGGTGGRVEANLANGVALAALAKWLVTRQREGPGYLRGCVRPFPYVASSREHWLTTSPSSGTGKEPPDGSGSSPSIVSSSASNAAR